MRETRAPSKWWKFRLAARLELDSLLEPAPFYDSPRPGAPVEDAAAAAEDAAACAGLSEAEAAALVAEKKRKQHRSKMNAAIRKQVSYYMGDENLERGDAFILGSLKASGDSSVSLRAVCDFKKMKTLLRAVRDMPSGDLDFVRDALSPIAETLEVFERDGEPRIRRVQPLTEAHTLTAFVLKTILRNVSPERTPPPRSFFPPARGLSRVVRIPLDFFSQSAAAQLEACVAVDESFVEEQERSVEVQRLARGATEDSLRALFQPCGALEAVSLNAVADRITATVLFAEPLGAVTAAETLNDEENWRFGLRVALCSGATPQQARAQHGALPRARFFCVQSFLCVGLARL